VGQGFLRQGLGLADPFHFLRCLFEPETLDNPLGGHPLRGGKLPQAFQGGVGEVFRLKAHPALQALEDLLFFLALQHPGGDLAFLLRLGVAGIREEEGSFVGNEDLGVFGVGKAR